jgi:hypothetical protein
MKTAVIVSGVMREMDLAIPTWNINGDFFLFVQDTYQDARRFSEQHKIIKDIETHSDKFKGICIVNKLETTDIFSSTLCNQTWKWRVAYNFLKPYIEAQGYERFIIIRPDSFLRIYRNLDELVIEPNTYYTTSNILTDNHGLLFANDTWIACDLKVFELLSNFYNFVISDNSKLNIHHTLATYLQKNNIQVRDDLLSFGETYQLRKEVRFMFEGNVLRDKYSYYDVVQEITEWNTNDRSLYRDD